MHEKRKKIRIMTTEFFLSDRLKVQLYPSDIYFMYTLPKDPRIRAKSIGFPLEFWKKNFRKAIPALTKNLKKEKILTINFDEKQSAKVICTDYEWMICFSGEDYQLYFSETEWYELCDMLPWLDEDMIA